MTVRVLVTDDHAMVRRGLVELLSAADGIDVVGQAANGREALARVGELDPDVVLMDLQMPEMDGVTATKQIAADSRAQVLVLTSFSDADRIVDALDAGAVGYMLKDAEPEDLIDAVHAVARGDSPLHPRVARQLLTARSARRSVDQELDGARARGARAGARRAGQQADRPPPRDQRAHREGPPHLGLRHHRRRGPYGGRPLGRAPPGQPRQLSSSGP